MAEPIIGVENLAKRYRVRQCEGAQPYVALRDVLASAVRSSIARLRRIGQPPRATCEDFWALRDVSFEVNDGEVIGIIGQNGAGKSTLLKVLSRVTEPTQGRVTLRGRVASLLEVGTGFHPELTGRENIWLNGAILGMSRREIKDKFDEIVSFAEVEQFLDTPVKRYSSGMYMRLAFAVAAHLDPEILIVDEVLAVGDAQFQKKCLRRMSEVASGGRTVLFVSHNMNAVESLCTHAILLENGQVQQQGRDVRAIIIGYLSASINTASPSAWINDSDALNHPVMQPLYFALENSHRVPLTAPARNDEQLFVVIRADVRQVDPSLCIGFALFNQNSELLLSSLTTDLPEERWPKLERGVMELRCALPRRFLNQGVYRLELNCSLHCREWLAQPRRNSPAIHFEIYGGLSDSPYWLSMREGILAPEWRWERAETRTYTDPVADRDRPARALASVH